MKKLLTILVLIMLIISFFQITSMYALYKEIIQGEYATLLGAWDIKVNTKDVTSSGQIEKFTIADNQLGYVLSEHIQAGKIAPGGKSYFDIVIDPGETDVSIIYQLNMESIDIPNAQIKLLSVDNLFKKDGETDVTNTQVKQDNNLYTAIIPIDKINQGYKNHLKLNFEWVNEDINSVTDSVYGNIECATNKNLIWTSSNETVATVSNGVITALTEGTSIITVKTIDGNFTDTCTVTVSDEEVEKIIPAVSTVLDQNTVTLKIGETEILEAIVYPQNVTNKNIVWTSDDEEVATVTNGVITAIAEGSATITATSVNGNFTDTCTVTVTEEAIIEGKELNVIGIDLDKTAVTLKKGETEVLRPSIWSENKKLSIPLEINLKQYTGEVISNAS